MYKVFGRTMQIFTWIGLTFLIFFGLLYTVGLMPGNITPEDSMKNWHKPTSEFWETTYGRKVDGYGWFLASLNTSDSLSLVGAALLALTPVICLFMAFLKAPGIYKIILFFLCLELVFAMMQPYIIGGGG
jgi:hypothetical protein